MIYGHYDVQPPEPLELWKTPPFAPRIAGRSIYARGAMDNKGQNFAHLKAVEAYLQTGTPLPCDLTFVIEGEEEIGSANLAKFLKSHRAKLNCDAVVISTPTFPAPNIPRWPIRCAASSRLKSPCEVRRAICTPASSAGPWKIRPWPSPGCSRNFATPMAA